jgi:membrane protein implicated in regulation of membrane protease activity
MGFIINFVVGCVVLVIALWIGGFVLTMVFGIAIWIITGLVWCFRKLFGFEV